LEALGDFGRNLMEIILLENIDELGTVGQTVKVKDGYARNYLLPRKLACLATPQNLNFYRSLIDAQQKKLAKEKEAAELLEQQMSAVTLTFTRKSREADTRLFGSVTNADIAEALTEKGFEMDKKRISLSEPVKKVGEYQAFIRLHPQVTATVPVIVNPEEVQEDAG
jgi:large subunit ribosomal protein L9